MKTIAIRLNEASANIYGSVMYEQDCPQGAWASIEIYIENSCHLLYKGTVYEQEIIDLGILKFNVQQIDVHVPSITIMPCQNLITTGINTHKQLGLNV